MTMAFALPKAKLYFCFWSFWTISIYEHHAVICMHTSSAHCSPSSVVTVQVKGVYGIFAPWSI